MGYTTFRSFFRKQFPHVKLSKQTVDKSASLRDVAGQSGQFEVIEEHLIDEEMEMEIGVKKEDMDESADYSNSDFLIYYDPSELAHEEIVN